MSHDLPYTVEYAKSNRAACKKCKDNIGKDTLRIGIMVQSPHFDGRVPLWHHVRCFFMKKCPASTDEINNFDNLRWEDQEKIREKLKKSSNGSGATAGNSDFSIEYSKSSRAACKVCGDKIPKGEIRISKILTDTPEALRYGPMPGWHHVDCFVKARNELGFLDSADVLPGFKSLEDEDQETVKQKLGTGIKRKIESDEGTSEPKKLPSRDAKTAADSEVVALKKQNELLYEMRDQLKAVLSKKEMIALLEYNNQHISTGESNLLDHLTDCLVFGALKTCPGCNSARPRYKFDGYRCAGNVSEWTRCQFVTKQPEREAFKIPEEFKEKYDFLNKYKYVKRQRVFPTKKENSIANSSLPLNSYKFAVFGKFSVPKTDIEMKVKDLGGVVRTRVDGTVDCCIASQSEVTKNSAKVKKACSLDIFVVSENFLEEVKKGVLPAAAIKNNSLGVWGGDPFVKFGVKKESVKSGSASSSSFSNSSLSSKKLKLTAVKGSAAVDPDSGMEDSCHVYQKKGVIFNVVLGGVDIARGKNTYYKLQLLEHNKKSKYYVFRSWGRVGTTIGGNKLEDFQKLPDAIDSFEAIYLDKSGNEWKDHKNFIKKPGFLYPLDIDYGDESEDMQVDLKPGVNSKLPRAVQDLICLIFDIEAMKKTMIEFEIDLQKMPLGRLSKKQVLLAYSVLTEAQKLLDESNQIKCLDVSNRFYTLIPHDFGLKSPPLLDQEELIKCKIEMLDSLLEIEYAYNIIKHEDKNSTKDPIDQHYEKLSTDIEVLDPTSNEFKIIETYLKNTHAATHNQYALQIDQIFKVNRHGESERYTAFKKLHNKKLLWHGSRLTNFVGILSQGLRIAPPEAPVTGYMFGKGVYFADMVSKSANYCFTSKKSPTGLLLLCEVALGDMYEKAHAEYIQQLPKGKHSTKGLGQTIPDPNETTVLDEAEVPYGKPVKSNIKNSSLLYNEYIVYDINQVNIKYLLNVSFKWKF